MKAKHSDSEQDAETEDAKSPQKKRNLHEGHRKRVRDRFFSCGFQGFQPHEVLEMLLFYAIPRCDTNKIAHELLDRFHTLSGVLDASPNELKQISGVSDYGATFLKMLPQLCSLYLWDKMQEPQCLDSQEKLAEFVRIMFVDAVQEKLLLICLDATMHLIHHEFITTGTIGQVLMDPQQIMLCTVRHHSDRIVVAHNHPGGRAIFSDKDQFATKHLDHALRGVGIKLLDHLLVGRCGDVSSIRQMGVLSQI